MSDVWQGPGWWLAPDGKWYPADGGPGLAASTTGTVGTAGTVGAGAAAAAGTAATAGAVAGAVVSDDAKAAGAEGATTAGSVPSPPASGWQAVEPDEAVSDDWTDPAVPSPVVSIEDGLDQSPVITPGAESTEADAPEADTTAASAVAAGVAGAGAGAAVAAGAESDILARADAIAGGAAAPPKPGAGGGPIERDEAWRKPTDGATTTETTTVRGAPEVVDLAVPESRAAAVGASTGLPWGAILKGLGLVAFLVFLALLINILFFGEDDTGLNTSSPTDTSSSAPSTVASTTTSAASSTSSTTATTAGTEVSVFDLRQGDCIEGEIGSGQVQRLIKVACSEPHEFEVYREAVIDNTITTYDEPAIEAQAEDVCRTSLAAYIPADDTRDLQFKWFQPTEESWNQPENPDRVITCLLYDENEKLVGRAA